MEIYSAVKFGPRKRIHIGGKSRTKQSMKDECDINLIVAKYVKTGAVDHLVKHGGDYGFASSVSFHEAMNVVTKADQMFLDLPAVLRRRFGGDPGEFLDFVSDPENQAEMMKMGLFKPEVVEAAEKAAAEAVAESASITPEKVPLESPPKAGSEGEAT